MQTVYYALLGLETSLELGKDPEALSESLACTDFFWLLPLLHRTR